MQCAINATMLYLRYMITTICLIFLAVFPAYTQDAPELFSPQELITIIPAQKQEMTYKVQWSGDPDTWLVASPQLPEISWGELFLAGVDVFQEDGMNTLQFRVAVQADEVGDYEVPAFNFHFQEGNTELAMDEQGAMVLPQRFMKTTAISFRAREPFKLPPTGLLLAAGIVALLIISTAVIYIVRRRNQQPAAKGISLLEQLQQSMHDARGMRLDGDYYAYYKSLSSVCERVAKFIEDGPALLHRLQERSQSVGYRGVQVTDETMDADWREVERAIARYRENAS